MNDWNQVWNSEDRINNMVLSLLINVDGFDSAEANGGSFKVEHWRQYVHTFSKHIGLELKHSIFDVGCGAGAFLFPFNNGKRLLGGLDYSKPLVSLANTIFKSHAFVHGEAIDIDTKSKFDVVLCHSVFQYFPNYDYARKVVLNMVEKANHSIAILDVNDASKQATYCHERIKSKNISEDDYQKKYQGLDHAFYQKQWFADIAKELNLTINIFDQTYARYSNADLRFNVVMEKP